MKGLATVARPVRVVMLWCQEWPLRTAQLTHGIASTEPHALVSKGVVVACSAAARREGVTLKLRVRQAQHRCPDLVVLPDSPDQQARAFEAVLRAMEERVPGVHVVRPGLAAVRAAGASRFYGSEETAALVLVAEVEEEGVADVRVAVADGLFAAEHAAYSTQPGVPVIVPAGESATFLATLPVNVVSELAGQSAADARMGGLLRKMGIRDLGSLAALPRERMHARFGTAGLRAHQLASGEDLPVLAPRTVPQDLAARTVLEPSCDQVENILALCTRAIGELVDRLTDASLVCNEIRCLLHTDGGLVHERVWRHPWQFTAADLLDRVSWQLQDLATLNARDDEELLSDAICEVEVEPESVDAAAHHAEGLWGERPDEHVVRTITQLQHQLGYDGVLTCAVGGGRLLDERRILRPWGDALPEARERRTEQPWPSSVPGPAPATVFTEIRPALVLDEAGELVTVGSRDQLNRTPLWWCSTGDRRDRRRITAWAGPWPVRQRWWRAEQRLSRFQLVDDRAQAWLVLTDGSRWWPEARYD